jgi:hypothetical protein
MKLPASGEIMIGSNGPKSFLLGLIDEVRIWDRVLSQEEIEKIYHREAAGLGSN